MCKEGCRRVHTLEEKKMIRRIKAEPENPRSKLLFKPTDKGGFIGILYFNVSYQKCFQCHSKETLEQLNSDFIDKGFGERLLLIQIEYYVKHNRFDKEGKQIQISNKEEAQLVSDTIVKIFEGQINPAGIGELEKRYGRHVMVKIKEYYEGIDELVHAILSELKKRGY